MSLACSCSTTTHLAPAEHSSLRCLKVTSQSGKQKISKIRCIHKLEQMTTTNMTFYSLIAAGSLGNELYQKLINLCLRRLSKLLKEDTQERFSGSEAIAIILIKQMFSLCKNS